MSSKPRFDPLGLAELDSTLADSTLADSTLAPDSALAADAADGANDGSMAAPAGMPADRAARIAARRAFVDMKQLFLRAGAHLDDRKGDWLRAQVRAAEDPIDLWLLRGPLLAALRHDDRCRALRAELYRTLDSVFPQAFGTPSPAPTPLPYAAGPFQPWQRSTVDARFSDAH